MKSNNGYQQFFKKAQENHVVKKRRLRWELPKVRLNKFLTRAGLWASASVAACTMGYTIYDQGEWINKALDKVDVSFFGSAHAADGKQAAAKNKKDVKKDAAKDAAAKGQKDPKEKTEGDQAEGSKKNWTDEEVALFTKLEARKAQLDAKELELQKLEAELQKQKDELEQRLGQLEEVRRRIASKLDEKVKVDQQKVESLVAVYQNMKPQQAAKIFEDMNEDLAVEVLTKMKNKSAAEILNMVKPEKAKILSERFAGYKGN